MGDTRYKILLIEDDSIDQQSFKRFVETENLPYDCTIAGSIADARTSLTTSQRSDVIISDYSLGDGTIIEITDLIGDTPVIFVTGATNEDAAIKAVGSACGYLVKDFNQNYLKALPEIIETALKHKHVT